MKSLLSISRILRCMFGKSILFVIIEIQCDHCFSQSHREWSLNEKRYYKTLKDFSTNLESAPNSLNDTSTILKNYIYFDYVYKDTSKAQINRKVKNLMDLLTKYKSFIDSVGVGNLEAEPIRFFKTNKEFYKPFEHDLKELVPLSFAYYNKNSREAPLGYLLFEDKSFRLVSWIIINQGGTYYFLTFNLM